MEKLKETIINYHNEVLEKTGYFLSGNKTPSDVDKLIIFAVLHYLIKSYRLFKGINLLCKNNLEQEAEILLRSLFEAYLLEEYVADKPNDITRAEDCAIRAHIADKKQLDEMSSLGMHEETLAIIKEEEKGEFKKLLDEVNEVRNLNFEEAMRRVRKKHPEWEGFSDAQIANRKKLEVKELVDILNKKYENKQDNTKNLIKKHYAVLTRDCSKSVHCNDLNYNVDRNDRGEWELFLESKSTMRELILLTSANIFIRIMEIADELLGFGKKDLVKDLYSKHRRYSDLKQDE